MRDWLEYFGYRLGAAVLPRVPLEVTHALARTVALAAFALGGRRRQRTLENLRVAFPELDEGERLEIGRESYVHFALNVLDFLRAEHWTAEEARRHIRIEGKENWEHAVAEGRGAFILTLHLGNFELAAMGLALYGIPTLVLGRRMRNHRLYSRLRHSRTRFGGSLTDRDNAAGVMLRELRKNGTVGILNDQYIRRSRGVFVPFFGVRASTSPGVARLALRTGARVLPCYAERDGVDHHTFHILPALEFEPSGDRETDVAGLTATCNAALESFVRRHPEQWMWGHRRFRHSPDLAREPYGATG